MDPTTRALMMGGAGAGGAEKIYVEDVFSTWLYSGNGSTQTITNGIDLAGKGGLVWLKNRSGAAAHLAFDTARGYQNALFPNLTSAQDGTTNALSSFNASGFSLSSNGYNFTGNNYASWTFRKAAKFFDVVTYTGNGDNSRDIAHNLGSKPGCIIIKRTDSASDWGVWHRGNGTDAHTYLSLNRTNSSPGWSGYQGYATATTFNVGTSYIASATEVCNVSGGTYVAYLFAHDAGGFGATGNDSIIKCGSFTATGGDVTVDLGWEPQWLLVRSAANADPWYIYDSMRGLTAKNSGTTGVYLQANSSNAETTSASNAYIPQPTSTGFIAGNSLGWGSGTMIYIAIRRGPMNTPTDATKVFDIDLQTGSGTISTGFPIDLTLNTTRTGNNRTTINRLTFPNYLDINSTSQEYSASPYFGFDSNTGFTVGSWWGSAPAIYYSFRRAPGFFDVVAYTGNGSASRTITHNLGVVPELAIIKSRSNADATFSQWTVGGSVIQAAGARKNLFLNATDVAATGYNPWYSTLPTSTVLTVSDSSLVNGNSQTYIAYLFASCSGVSKVGSYTGTGTTQQINCGFTNGARFVLIKRTDGVGNWFVFDTARGITSGSDPWLILNSSQGETTIDDFIDPLNSGFEISSTAPDGINANGGNFIYLAIA